MEEMDWILQRTADIFKVSENGAPKLASSKSIAVHLIKNSYQDIKIKTKGKQMTENSFVCNHMEEIMRQCKGIYPAQEVQFQACNKNNHFANVCQSQYKLSRNT